MLTPEKIAASGSEDSHQTALFMWAQQNTAAMPTLALMYHCPNGGRRNLREAARFKAMGVKAGVPDIFLPVARLGWHGLYIELKTLKGIVAENQKEWHRLLTEQRYCVKVCYGWEAARDVLKAYLEME